jgi:mannose-6-phosphate isomerase-like protein (cupin superfamily)
MMLCQTCPGTGLRHLNSNLLPTSSHHAIRHPVDFSRIHHCNAWRTSCTCPDPSCFTTAAASTQSTASPTPLILEENDGEHRLRRPQGPAGSKSVPEFITKIDKLNGNAQDFYVGYEILKPGGMIPLHKHHNSEEVVILEEGGATVTVGDKRSVTGPHAIVFIPRETWVSVANTGNSPIHLYGFFSHQGFENFLRARSVRSAVPLRKDTSLLGIPQRAHTHPAYRIPNAS